MDIFTLLYLVVSSFGSRQKEKLSLESAKFERRKLRLITERSKHFNDIPLSKIVSEFK